MSISCNPSTWLCLPCSAVRTCKPGNVSIGLLFELLTKCMEIGIVDSEVSVMSPSTTTASEPADRSLPYGLQRRPGHATMAARYAGLVVIIELGCFCLTWRYVPAKFDTGMQRLPPVLNDKSQDCHAADYCHADASTLVRETAERSFGKRGASDICNFFSATLVGSASQMTIDPRVKRRPCHPDCRFVPTRV